MLYKIIKVLYGSETRFLTLREEHRLNKFENRATRGISARNGGRNNKETGKKLHNEEYHKLLRQIQLEWPLKENEIGRAHNTHGKKMNAYRGLVGNP
jgi:hypothetical protein